MTILGRLEPMDRRCIWDSEAGQFTHWRAQPDNLKLLGQTIGIELESDAHEQRVAIFRTDILCKDTITNKWILVKNQIEGDNRALKKLGALHT